MYISGIASRKLALSGVALASQKTLMDGNVAQLTYTKTHTEKAKTYHQYGPSAVWQIHMVNPRRRLAKTKRHY